MQLSILLLAAALQLLLKCCCNAVNEVRVGRVDNDNVCQTIRQTRVLGGGLTQKFYLLLLTLKKTRIKTGPVEQGRSVLQG